MIFFDSINNINKDSDLYKYMSSTLKSLYKQLNLQKNKKKNLIIWTNKIADMCVGNSSNADTTALLSNIEELKNNLNNIRTNIEDINKLISYLKNITSSIDNPADIKKDEDLSLYYTLYIEKQNVILERDIKVEALLGKIYEYSSFNVPVVKEENKVESSEKNNTPTYSNCIENSDITTNVNDEKTISDAHEAQITEKDNQCLSDNDTLTISETQNTVFLPYKISDLELTLKENQKKYESIEDIINKDYTIPLSRYKNSSLSRFREAFLLMKEREKASFSKALDLALELTFKYNLNPAIITACKNLDELDIYLDCLDSTNLDNFKIFNIKYEIPPIKI